MGWWVLVLVFIAATDCFPCTEVHSLNSRYSPKENPDVSYCNLSQVDSSLWPIYILLLKIV